MIKYTDSQYANSYLTGELYLSSLSLFWNLHNNGNGVVKQQDFSEGVATQLPHDVLEKVVPESFANRLIHDARFRLEAYGYCNLLCFFRIDAIDTFDAVSIDTRYTGLVKFNPVLNSKMNHVFQVPDDTMMSFGDTVVIIKDEEKFVERVLAAVSKAGGECVIGDVQYHPMIDRLDPSAMNKHHISLITDEGDSHKGLFDMKALCGKQEDAIIYGSLDKYDIYAEQKEWRVCWLPKVKNKEPKILHVGDMHDIIEIIPTADLLSKLQRIFPGYHFGLISEIRKRCVGTLSYREFRHKVEAIDGKCRLIFDIG